MAEKATKTRKKGKSAITGKGKGEFQDTATPPMLINAILSQLGTITWDLAASRWNKVCRNYVSKDEGVDSLCLPWHQLVEEGIGYINPPYAFMEPWAAKCYMESLAGANLVMLSISARDTDWYRRWVLGNCLQIDLNGRLVFIDPLTGLPHATQKCVCGGVINGETGELEKCGQRDCGKWTASPYPKPCMLTVWGPKVPRGIGWWDWKKRDESPFYLPFADQDGKSEPYFPEPKLYVPDFPIYVPEYSVNAGL